MLKRMSVALPVLFLLLAMLGLSAILALYSRLSHLSELDVLESFSLAIDQIAITLQDRMGFAEDTMRALLYDSRVYESISRPAKEETLEAQLEEIQDLRDAVYSTVENRDLLQVRLYMSDVKMITREGINFFTLTEARDTPEYALLLASDDVFSWIGAHAVHTNYFDDTCVTLGCMYQRYNAESDDQWAMLLLDMSVERFTGVLDTLTLTNRDAHIAVVDAAGTVMCGGESDAIRDVVADGDVPTNASAVSGFCASQAGGQLAYVRKPLGFAGWSIVACMPRASLLEGQRVTRNTLTLLLFGFTLLMIALLGIALLALYVRRVRLYLHDLNDSLNASGRHGASLHVRRALFSLDLSIAELLRTNERLTEENYRAQLREHEVKLQALQAQINPHFLYNTLDSINWMAIRENASDVSDALVTLADYFRLSLSRGRSVVTLREDAQIVQKYLALYERRFDYQYQVIWALQEDALDCLIPKLTLQPLVENALQHGIFKRPDKLGGIVRISAHVTDDRMTLSVQDNGPGLSGHTVPGKGYGLSNVRERLDLYFEGRYRLQIGNAPEGGVLAQVQVAVERDAPDRSATEE